MVQLTFLFYGMAVVSTCLCLVFKWIPRQWNIRLIVISTKKYLQLTCFLQFLKSSPGRKKHWLEPAYYNLQPSTPWNWTNSMPIKLNKINFFVNYLKLTRKLKLKHKIKVAVKDAVGNEVTKYLRICTATYHLEFAQMQFSKHSQSKGKMICHRRKRQT